ncbi:MAG TPA: sugar-binding domain-containing protein [Oculatellaceae cyanobacterium]
MSDKSCVNLSTLKRRTLAGTVGLSLVLMLALCQTGPAQAIDIDTATTSTTNTDIATAVNTVASDQTDSTGHGYPRPQLARPQWLSLNGNWEFEFDNEAKLRRPADVRFDAGRIRVPFAPECKASGIDDKSFHNAVWYRRLIDTPKLGPDERLILHFGAVDWHAQIWVNDHLATEHDGGYTPFSADITDLLENGRPQTLVVRAADNPHDLEKNRGKQTWDKEAGSILYPRTTGIWQTVWMEVVKDQHVNSFDWQTSLKDGWIGFRAQFEGTFEPGMTLNVKLSSAEKVLGQQTFPIRKEECEAEQVTGCIAISELKQDSQKLMWQKLAWHPDHPKLIAATIELRSKSGSLIDQFESYTQVTTTSTDKQHFVFNGRNEPLRLVLDQGYWLDSGMTPPNDEAIVRDIKLIKAAGFNGVRLHNKIEDPRFLYWADRLGIFVWEELPSAFLFSEKAVRRSTNTWMEAITRDSNHGCIIVWVPFNESWGIGEQVQNPNERQYQLMMYRLTKILTNGGIVVGNDGWEIAESDIVSIHDYDSDLNRLASRYSNDKQSLERLLHHEQPGEPPLILEGFDPSSKPFMLTEFGGIKYSNGLNSWGYSEARTPEELGQKYASLMRTIHELPLFAGFCYTQFTDVYQETNGLFRMNREPKFPIEKMRKATCGN